MPRLFTALWPPEPAITDLAAALAALPRERIEAAGAGLRRFRFLPPATWHLTLRFHGPAEPAPLADHLDAEVAGLGRPRMRLAGAGTFRGVLWVGAEPAGPADAAALRALVRAAGGEPEGFRAHLTLARWNAGRPRPALRELLDGYAGPFWEAAELALVRSDRDATGSTYRTVHRAELPSGDAGETGGDRRP